MVNKIEKLQKNIERESKEELLLNEKIEEIKNVLVSKLKIDKNPLDGYGIIDISELTVKFWDDGKIAVFEKKYDNYLHSLSWEYFQDYDLWNLKQKLQDLNLKNNFKERVIITAKQKLNLC